VLRIVEHERIGARDAVPTAIAGACQEVFVAELRNQANRDEYRESVLNRLEADLRRVCRSLRSLR
jgi:hypothetical protein